MARNLKMKCLNCGHWNRVPVNKIFVEQFSPKPKVQVLIPMYEPLKVETCKKCGKLIAEPKELIRIVKDNSMGWIKEASLRGELKITENRNCPFCNPERKTNVETKINAHKEHKWVNKTWYENTFKNKQWIQK